MTIDCVLLIIQKTYVQEEIFCLVLNLRLGTNTIPSICYIVNALSCQVVSVAMFSIAFSSLAVITFLKMHVQNCMKACNFDYVQMLQSRIVSLSM